MVTLLSFYIFMYESNSKGQQNVALLCFPQALPTLQACAGCVSHLRK